jgi:hypothetical protein
MHCFLETAKLMLNDVLARRHASYRHDAYAKIGLRRVQISRIRLRRGVEEIARGEPHGLLLLAVGTLLLMSAFTATKRTDISELYSAPINHARVLGVAN